MKKTIVCTVCPNGCQIEADCARGAEPTLTGYRCERGKAYAMDECVAPKRTFTGSVHITGAGRRILPVRSRGPIPRELLERCAEETHTLSVTAPVASHQVLIKNLLGSGVDLIASMSLEREA